MQTGLITCGISLLFYLYNYVVCVEDSLRLVNGATDMEGRVEICVNDTWTSICSNLWTTNDGNVACKQLGFSQLSKPLLLNSFLVDHCLSSPQMPSPIPVVLVLVLGSSTLEACSALAMSKDWLTVHVVQQPAAITRLMLELPVLQVRLSCKHYFRFHQPIL